MEQHFRIDDSLYIPKYMPVMATSKSLSFALTEKLMIDLVRIHDADNNPWWEANLYEYNTIAVNGNPTYVISSRITDWPWILPNCKAMCEYIFNIISNWFAFSVPKSDYDLAKLLRTYYSEEIIFAEHLMERRYVVIGLTQQHLKELYTKVQYPFIIKEDRP